MRSAVLPSGKPAIEGGPSVRSSFLVYGQPQIHQAEIDEVVATLRSGWISTGPRTARFEDAFREYKGSRHAAAVGSCTAGLHLALTAAGIGEGDEVITTPMTFCATANVIVHSGAEPVFADCDRRTMNIDPALVEQRIGPRTKAVIPVHFAGRPCDMDGIMEISRRHDLVVIEDCAHAIETRYKGRNAGTIGDLSSFSFYATKNLCTGEGGMVLTDDDRLHSRIKILALHGMSRDAWRRFGDGGYKHYRVGEPGYKYNMMDLQAALGIHQFGRVEKNWKIREAIWSRYDDAFGELPCFGPLEPEPNTRHAYHMYNLLLDIDRLRVDRDLILEALTRENVGVGVHYLPLHTQPYYAQRFGHRAGDYPNAEWIGERTLSLPLTPSLTESDVSDVIEAVVKVLTYYGR